MLLIADNLTVTSRAVREALGGEDPGPVQDIVKRCEAAGAGAIDINPGPLPRDPEKKMRFLVSAVQAVTGRPVLIDTANPRAMEAGLQAGRGQVIINGFSLEPAKLELILPLAERYDADIIGYLLRHDGHVPSGSDEKLQAAVDLYSRFRAAGLSDQRLIVDPVMPPVAWESGSRQAMEVLEVIRRLPEVLGFPVRTIAGLSNLTAGDGPVGCKQVLEQAFLPMLAESGLSMVMLNMFHTATVSVAKACRMLMSEKIFSWAELD